MAITMSTLFTDLGKVLAAYANLNAIAGTGAQHLGYKFTCTAVSTQPVLGTTYTDANGVVYTVLATTKASGTNVAMSGPGTPPASGTLTKVTSSGNGDTTITYSAVTAYPNWIAATVSSMTTGPSAGDTYSNNGFIYTVMADAVASSGTLIAIAGNGIPAATGSLVQVTGAGDATITMTAITRSYTNWTASAATTSAASYGRTSYIGAGVKNQNTMVNDILARLQGTGLTNLIGYNNWQGTLQGLDASIVSQKTVLSQLVQQIIIARVNNDVPQSNPTSFPQAATELLRQMQIVPTTVSASTIGHTLTAGSNNTGNAVPYVSYTDANGLQLDYTFAETMILECTQDQNSGASAGSETVSVTAPAAVTNTLSSSWPAGSGFSGTLTVVDPTLGFGTGGNLVGSSSTGGCFKAWTGSVPNGWAVSSGGTIISDGTSSNYGGTAHCLEIAGDSSTTATLYQNFANGGISSGSTVTLLPNTVYQFYAQVKRSNTSATGVIWFSLTDGSLNEINNNQGIVNRVALNVGTGLTGTGYNTITGTFQTPTKMPTNCRLMITTHTVINAYNIFIDFLTLVQPASQSYGGLYTGGPYMSIFRGSTDLIRFQSYTIGDYWTYATTNNYGSASPQPLSFNPLLNATCGLAGLGIILPTAGTPVINDSLIS